MPDSAERVITVTRRLRLEERTCPICGQTFMGTWQQKYDTNACEQRAAYARNAEKRRAARRERYARQRIEQDAALPQFPARLHCVDCGRSEDTATARAAGWREYSETIQYPPSLAGQQRQLAECEHCQERRAKRQQGKYEGKR